MKDKTILAAFLAILMMAIPLAVTFGKNPTSQGLEEFVPHIDTDRTNAYFSVYVNGLDEVQQIDYIDYICGVLAAECPVSFHPEALRAQAVAVYTYALKKREIGQSNPCEEHKGADVCSDYHHCKSYMTPQQQRERWGDDYDANTKKIRSVVDSVRDQAMVYEGSVITAVFFAISSGKTEAAADVWGSPIPYLVSVESEGDPTSAGYESTVQFSAEELKAKILEKFGETVFPENPSEWITDISRSDAGGITLLNLCGNQIKGTEMRTLLDLRSTNFEQSFTDGMFTFRVRGYGHDVGMSQYGADYYARQGMSWQDILKHYYTGIEIVEWKL